MPETITAQNRSTNFYDSDSKDCKEVIQQGDLVMVDFWSKMCGPCRSLMPILAELADKHPELCIIKIEIEENVSLADEYDVKSVPSLLLFKNSECLDRLIGKAPYPLIENMLKTHIQ